MRIMAHSGQRPIEPPSQPAEREDADLVARSLAGSRDAFRAIVERYQNLICSLAYSATGNLCQSEDLAQETFVSAWTDLRSLREPDKLRPWLCGIVRNRIHRRLRTEVREPVCGAVALEEARDSASLDALPSEQTISREEEAILWRAVEKIPELYREPLILFYRQHQSIGRVATELALSEDAVKQRLSRGRKLLQEEVQVFVENTLRRTAPGQAFSGAVLASLPLAAGSGATAGIGAGAKGATAAKPGFLAACLAPFIGIVAGIAAQWLIIRATTTDPKLRAKLILRIIVIWILLLTVAIAGPNAVLALARHFQWSERTVFVSIGVFWWCYAVVVETMSTIGFRRMLETCRRNEEALQASPPGMGPGTRVAVVAGTHLMLFSWLVRLAWRADDLVAAGAIAGIMVLMGVLSFFRTRGLAGSALLRAATMHVASCAAVILAILNLRFIVWAAAAYGVSVAELSHRLPTWMIPLLTLALLIWSAAIGVLTKPKTRQRGQP
jgi:RNA polymerase sigma factor (sigma-70 family)